MALERSYHCPICGKTYATLTDMYDCAVTCEKKEEEKIKLNKAIETKRKTAEEEIFEIYSKLKKKIDGYNTTYPKFSFESSLKHSEKQTTVSTKTTNSNKNNKKIKNITDSIKEKNLEELLSELFEFPNIFED